MASLICLFHPLTSSDTEQIIVQIRAFKKQKGEQEGRKPRKQIWREFLDFRRNVAEVLLRREVVSMGNWSPT